MQLQLNPVTVLSGRPETTLSVKGDTITVDGVDYDLSAIPEGGEATAQGDHPFAGPITRAGGVLNVPVRVVLGPDAEHRQPTDPAHWRVEAPDGPVTIPATRKAEDPQP